MPSCAGSRSAYADELYCYLTTTGRVTGHPDRIEIWFATAATISRLAARPEFTGADDYLLCKRRGRRLDASALRRRYKRGCAAAGLRPVRLHGLRHAGGSLVAWTSDAVFVRDFIGHAKLATTDRYLSAKLRPEELKRLDEAFAAAAAKDADAADGETDLRPAGDAAAGPP